jgi:hypothetical protein
VFVRIQHMQNLKKKCLHRDFFSRFVLCPYFFVLALPFVLTLHHTQLFVLIALALPFALYCTKHTHTHTHTQKTNIRVPGRIRTRNPSKRSAGVPLLRLLGHLYWPDSIQNISIPKTGVMPLTYSALSDYGQ